MIEYTSISAHYSGEEREYTFLCPIELAHSLHRNDIVVVKAANGLGVVRVLEVHGQSQATGPYNYRWAFQKVDMDHISTLEAAQEEKKIEPYISDADDIPFESEVEKVKAAMAERKLPEKKEEAKAPGNPTKEVPKSPPKSAPPKIKIPHVPKL